MLGILAVLNWLMSAVWIGLLFVIWVTQGSRIPFDAFSFMAMILMIVALPYAYLGYAIEQGKGRIMQTIFAVIALCNFPLGTAYGAFALWVCWSAEAKIFDQGGAEQEAAPRPRRSAPVVDDIEDEVTAPRAGSRSPYQLVQQLKKQGLKSGDVQERLHVEGLNADEIETLMTSVGLKFSRVKQKHLEEFS